MDTTTDADADRGLYGKYRVEKTNGKPVGECFVLEAHDRHAIAASAAASRTLRDAYDYNPIQVVTGQRLGWYSADDGEMCPECMARLLGRTN